MKLSFLPLAFLLSITSVFSQNFSVQTSEVFKRTKNESIPDIVGIDETGIYLSSYSIKRKYARTDYEDYIYTLIKYNHNFKEKFTYKYEEDLNKSEVVDIYFAKGKLYLFSFIYEKKQKIYRVYGTTLSKENGKFETPLKEITSVFSDNDRQVRISPSIYFLSDPSVFVIKVWYVDGNEKMYHFAVADLGLTKTFNTSYKCTAGEEEFYPIDVEYTKDKELILLDENHEPEPDSKKKNRDLVHTSYSISKFSPEGKRVYSNKILLENKYLIKATTRLTSTNELLVSGFICKSAKHEEITGLMLNKYNISSGELISSSEFIPPAEMLSNEQVMTEVLGKVKTIDGMKNNLRTPRVINNPVTNSIILLTEFFALKKFAFRTGPVNSNDYSTNFTFLNGPLVFAETDPNYQITKISTLPKNQVHKMTLSGNYGEDITPGIDGHSASVYGRSLDFYSSFGHVSHNNKMFILINDHPANGRVTKSSDYTKICDDFDKITTYVLIYDFATGTITRKQLFNNVKDMPIPMVRYPKLVGDDIFLLAMLPHVLGKTEYQFIKITIK